jgi:hypothetical protein
MPAGPVRVSAQRIVGVRGAKRSPPLEYRDAVVDEAVEFIR